MISWNRKLREPIPHYEKNDTSAAGARIADLRIKESPPVPRELVTPIDALASRWKPPVFHAVCEGVDARPTQPAIAGWQPRRQPISPPRRDPNQRIHRKIVGLE